MIPSDLRDAVIARDNGLCRYCGDEATSIDHVDPRVNGGSNDMANLVAACRTCNSTAGGKVFESFEAKAAHIAKARAELRLPFGVKLNTLRQLKGLTIQQFANKVGLPEGTTERLMRGSNAPSAWALVRIMKTFDVTFEPEDFER